jgi:hypothetical protein
MIDFNMVISGGMILEALCPPSPIYSDRFQNGQIKYVNGVSGLVSIASGVEVTVN